MHFSHTTDFSKNFNPKNNEISHGFFMKFMTFSASIFASIFSSIFDGKWLPEWSGKMYVFWPRELLYYPPVHTFRDLFRRSIFWCILVAPWLTFGSLLAPIGSLLAPFGSLLAPVGSLLALFGSLLAHFWCPLAHFWCPLLHFCSPGDPFSHFRCILASFFIFLGIFHENIMQNHSFKQFSLQITFSVNQIVVSRSVPNAPQQKVNLLLQPILQGPGAEWSAHQAASFGNTSNAFFKNNARFRWRSLNE